MLDMFFFAAARASSGISVLGTARARATYSLGLRNASSFLSLIQQGSAGLCSVFPLRFSDSQSVTTRLIEKKKDTNSRGVGSFLFPDLSSIGAPRARWR